MWENIENDHICIKLINWSSDCFSSSWVFPMLCHVLYASLRRTVFFREALSSWLIKKPSAAFKGDEKRWCDWLSLQLTPNPMLTLYLIMSSFCPASFPACAKLWLPYRVVLAPLVSKNGKNQLVKSTCTCAVKGNKTSLCLIKDLIENILMTCDMWIILLLHSGHAVSLRLIWCEAGIQYLCTLLGDIYDMSAGGQDGLLTSSSSSLPVPVGATHGSPGTGVR